MPSALAHYQEIALKGKNRPWFLNRLLRNLRAMLADLDVQEVRAPMGRVEITIRN
jgi:thiamine biosynthesis protein ThiI